MGMRAKADLEVEIAGRATAQARRALAGQADALAFGNPLGDTHVEGAGAGQDAAIGAKLGNVQGDGLGRAPVGILQRDLDAGHLILATHPKTASAGSARPASPEQRLEEIAELADAEVAAEGEALLPARRRPKLLPRLPVGAELVVGLAL